MFPVQVHYSAPSKGGDKAYFDERVCLNVFVSLWAYLRNYKSNLRRMFVRAVCAPAPHTAKDEESARDNYVLACNFAKYLPSFKKFTHRLNL